jgi:methionyl-tRNA formyltransferase
MKKKELSIVWVGFHTEGQPALKRLCREGLTPKAIITLDKQSSGKRSGVWHMDEFCSNHGIPLYKVSSINDPETVALLESLAPTVLCVIGWSQILKKPALATSEFVIGAHASLLPHNRGSAPVNWALINGEKKTGNTLIVLSEGVDSGDILSQREFDITLYDSCKTLYDKVADTNADMIVEFLRSVQAGSINRRPQVHTHESVLPRRKPEDGLINWKADAADVYNFVRALTQPYPGAFSYCREERVIIWDASWTPGSNENGPPGSVASVNYSFVDQLCSVQINCGDGCISVYRTELEDGRILVGKELIDFFEEGESFDGG